MIFKNGHSSDIDNIGHTNMQETFGHWHPLTVFLAAHSCYKIKTKQIPHCQEFLHQMEKSEPLP